MNQPSELDTLGQQFVSAYYGTLATNKENLQSFYTDNSTLSFEGTKHVGKANIMAKIMGLTFKTINHAITTMDCQGVFGDVGVIIKVLGKLKTDEDPPHSFSQTFVLGKLPTGSFFIANEIFRMVLHDS